MNDIRTLLFRATRCLADSGSPSPRLDAEVLLMRFLGMDRVQLCMEPGRQLAEEQVAGFEGWVERRRLGEPVAYITGTKEFWSLAFEVGRGVLIPRPETECLIEEALRLAEPPGAGRCIADIGTGRGAIAVIVARALPQARVVATDISPAALAVARRNAMVHGVAGRMDFVRGDLLTALSGAFDLICSNPPYIPDEAYALLPVGIRAFEPREALIAGPEGMDFYRRIIAEAQHCLAEGGWIVLEIGEGQRDPVGALLETEGYGDIAFRKDYGGIDRVALARKKRG
jgi:release factor glutamine methyltransferase